MLPRRLAIALLVLSACIAHGAEDGFRDLFNGKDFTGWVPVNTAPSTWTVKDGMIICSGKPTGEIRTDRMYQNFILELEWRHMKPKGNAGVFIWADDITAKGVPFHRGIEVQVLENAYGQAKWYTTHGDIFPIHGAKMTPINGRGGSRAFPTEERSKPCPNWNHYRIECNDGAISLAVNGKVVTRGTDCSPRKGYICLESEGGVAHYRNLRIKELPDTPVAPEDVAIADRGYKSLYTGVDLSGWSQEAGGKWQSRNWVLQCIDVGSPLVTERHFGPEFGFLFDVGLKKGSKPTRVVLHGTDATAITLDPADPLVGKHLSTKGWNRFEGVIQDGKLSFTVNGKAACKDRPIGEAPPRAPICIEPAGPVDFANLFVREVGGAKEKQ